MKIIDKDGLLKRLIEIKHEHFADDKRKTRAIDKVIEIVTHYPHIESYPSQEAIENRKGVWKKGVPFTCSVCGGPAPDEHNTDVRYSCWISPYCPHCGAKMDGERQEAPTIRETKVNVILKLRELFELHFGTYAEKDEVKVRDIFSMLNTLSEEILEGSKNGL